MPYSGRPDCTMVHFISDFQHLEQQHPILQHFYKRSRLEILPAVKHFLEQNEETAEQLGNPFVYDPEELFQEQESPERNFTRRSTGGGHRKSQIGELTESILEKQVKHNPSSIVLKAGEVYPLHKRLPNYRKLDNGDLLCEDPAILNAHKGIFMDLIKRAGKKLMEGRGVVAVSLPVRIFERRSTLERICDLWSTGPIYLARAGRTDNPVERMKCVICFAISGMHMAADMRKPFNPILGETLEGEWPDGSKVYIEHVSHHPPISCFLVCLPV